MKGKKCTKCGQFKVFTDYVIFQLENYTESDRCHGCNELYPPRIEKQLNKTKKMERKRETNKRLGNFNKILKNEFEAPYPEKKPTGIRGFIEAFERPLREIQAARRKDKTRDIDMGEDKDFELKL